MTAFWDMALCSVVEVDRRFRGVLPSPSSYSPLENLKPPFIIIHTGGKFRCKELALSKIMLPVRDLAAALPSVQSAT